MFASTFSNLKACIDSWYGDKAGPEVVVTLKGAEAPIEGELSGYSATLITIKDGDGKLHEIRVDNIKQVQLTWHGDENTMAAGQQMMGELDGSGLSGAAVRQQTFRHRVTPTRKNGWDITTIE